MAVARPSRFSAFWIRCKRPASSSTMRMGPGSVAREVSMLGGNAFGDLRDLHHAHEEADVFDGVGKFIVVQRLDDVVVAAQLVTALHFPRIIRSSQHADGYFPQFRVGLELPQNLDAVHLGHANIEEEEVRSIRGAAWAIATAKEKIENFLTIFET